MASRIALFIGNSSYDDTTLTRLKTPAADVRALAAALRDPGIGEFDEVRELIDENEAAVRRAVADFFTRRHPEDLLLLYFSGHGVKDDRGRLYLAVRDTACNQLSATGIASSFITEHMDECRSKRQILILDCCNSGAFARGTKGDPTALTADTFAGNGYGRVVLTASDSTQYALEGDRVIERAELSLFTHYLIEGLTNGAATSDEVVTLDALYDYAYGRIVSTTPGQTPRKWVYNQQGSLVIAKNPRRREALPLAIAPDLRMRIQDARAPTRLAAIADLGAMLDSHEWSRIIAARSVLERIADADRSQRVRQAAREALNARAAALHAQAAPSPPTGHAASPAGAGRPSASATPAGPTAEAAGVQAIGDALKKLPSSAQIAETLGRLPVDPWLSKLSARGAWLAATALAFTIAAIINGGILGRALFNPMANLPASRLIAGGIEGGLLGVALWIVMRHRGASVDSRRWLIAMIVADIVRWQIPFMGAPFRVTTSSILLKGILDGLLMGFAQAWALRLTGFIRQLWMGTNLAGWIVVMFLFIRLLTAFTIPAVMAEPMIPSIVIGLVTGLTIGAATAIGLPLALKSGSTSQAHESGGGRSNS